MVTWCFAAIVNRPYKMRNTKHRKYHVYSAISSAACSFLQGKSKHIGQTKPLVSPNKENDFTGEKQLKFLPWVQLVSFSWKSTSLQWGKKNLLHWKTFEYSIIYWWNNLSNFKSYLISEYQILTSSFTNILND